MDAPLRIALVSSRYAPSTGGIQCHVQALAEHLSRSGHRVTVLTHDLDRGDPTEEDLNGVHVVRFLPVVPAEHLLVSPALGRYLADHGDRFDVVHAHGYHDTPAAMVMRHWDGPYVFTPHYHGTSESRARALLHVPYRRIGRKVASGAARIICVTGAEREQFLQHFPTAAERTQVISNGVDVSRFLHAPVRPPETDGRRLVVVAGRLEHYKRVDRVIEAMAQLRGDFVLEVCGDGPARADLEAQVVRHELGDAVRIRGRVTDLELASTIRSAAVLVSMSEHEAQGIVLLEATAAGTPSVASAIPAHVDVRRQTEGAVELVQPGADAGELARSIAHGAAQPRPDQLVLSWSEVALQTEMVYRQALGADGTGSGTAPAVAAGGRDSAG
jgi:glycosyltransferase involved in cell wall biosynthesis